MEITSKIPHSDVNRLLAASEESDEIIWRPDKIFFPIITRLIKHLSKMWLIDNGRKAVSVNGCFVPTGVLLIVLARLGVLPFLYKRGI